jgi:hypothetical protein
LTVSAAGLVERVAAAADAPLLGAFDSRRVSADAPREPLFSLRPGQLAVDCLDRQRCHRVLYQQRAGLARQDRFRIGLGLDLALFVHLCTNEEPRGRNRAGDYLLFLSGFLLFRSAHVRIRSAAVVVVFLDMLAPCSAIILGLSRGWLTVCHFRLPG